MYSDSILIILPVMKIFSDCLANNINKMNCQIKNLYLYIRWEFGRGNLKKK